MMAKNVDHYNLKQLSSLQKIYLKVLKIITAAKGGYKGGAGVPLHPTDRFRGGGNSQ